LSLSILGSTRSEDTVQLETSYRRSKTTGHNSTSCKQAMGSITAQIRAAVKSRFAAEMAKKGKGGAIRLENDEYSKFIEGIFNQVRFERPIFVYSFSLSSV
jgi:hypothetical protein